MNFQQFAFTDPKYRKEMEEFNQLLSSSRRSLLEQMETLFRHTSTLEDEDLMNQVRFATVFRPKMAWKPELVVGTITNQGFRFGNQWRPDLFRSFADIQAFQKRHPDYILEDQDGRIISLKQLKQIIRNTEEEVRKQEQENMELLGIPAFTAPCLPDKIFP